MLYPAVFAITASLFAATEVMASFPPNSAYVGCSVYGTYYVVQSPIPFPGGIEACKAACVTLSGPGLPSQTAGYRFSFWNPMEQRCACNFYWQWPGYDTASDPSLCGTTNTNDYQGYFTKTTFTSVSCADTQTLDPRDAGSAKQLSVEPHVCSSLCASYKYMILHPNINTYYSAYYDCQCANYPPTDTPTTVCAQQTYFLYTHPPEAQASALPRKRAAARALELQRLLEANPHCPVGYDACNVSNDPSHGYECINTNEELESCGGCRFGRYGNTNATAPGVE
ncbi:hypothetical protein Q8F55_001611 [Vanrija albida]|uniref:Uncharacterized protein n=1 Tax=Vanrija albida TaxID=181172 RepID=A0ABR3QH55_9TREE